MLGRTHYPLYVMAQGEMQTQEADGWSLTMFNNPKRVGKRMVVDRQKGKTRSESRRYRVAGRLKVRQAQGQAGRYGVQKTRVKIGRTSKREKENRRTGKHVA